jgi:colanic acid/amylovoran biosynthesis glycosyltransferase
LIQEVAKHSFKEKLKIYAITGPVILENCDIFHVQWAKSLESFMFLQEYGIKLMLSLRGAHINYSPIADVSLAESYRRTFPLVNGFHAVSAAIAKESTQYGASPNKIKVIYSGLNTDEFVFRPARNIPGETLKILSIGRPHWKKSYHLALDALSDLLKEGFDFHYTITGGVNEELIFQIHDLNLQRHVTIFENIPINEVKNQIHSHHLLLLPSVEEGIANVVLESMALGTLVLSSDCGGMKEAIEHGRNGFIFENRNREDLKNQLLSISKMREQHVLDILSDARNKIEEKFSDKKMIAGFRELYSREEI